MLFRSDRKSTRLNSSHTIISYAVFCLKKKKTEQNAPDVEPGDGHERGTLPPAGRALLILEAGGVEHVQDVDSHEVDDGFFFFNEGAPPEFSPFPPPAAFPF